MVLPGLLEFFLLITVIDGQVEFLLIKTENDDSFSWNVSLVDILYGLARKKFSCCEKLEKIELSCHIHTNDGNLVTFSFPFWTAGWLGSKKYS